MTKDEKAVRGRALDDALTQRILKETLSQLSRDGYAKLRIERIAAAVGCGKATIYRRWSDRGELAAEAIATQMQPPTDPDTGDPIEDLITFTFAPILGIHQRDPHEDPTWSAVFETDIRPHLWRLNFALRREVGRGIIERGKAQSVIPAHVDADLLLDAVSGFSIYRPAFRGEYTTREDVARLVSMFCGIPSRTSRL